MSPAFCEKESEAKRSGKVENYLCLSFSTISLVTMEFEEQNLVKFEDQTDTGNENFGEDFTPILLDH